MYHYSMPIHDIKPPINVQLGKAKALEVVVLDDGTRLATVEQKAATVIIGGVFGTKNALFSLFLFVDPADIRHSPWSP